MSPLLRTLRTVRRQTPGQLAARLVYEARLRCLPVAAPWLRWSLRADAGSRAAALGAVFPLGEATVADRALAASWLQGEAAPLGVRVPREQWEAGGLPKLWRYERHYHAELLALARTGALAEARALVESWAAACPPPLGDAWEPYPVARRVLSWSVALAAAPELGPRLAPLLAPQLRFVSAHLERHLLGNHLLCDAAALCAGASVLHLRQGERLFARGARLLAGELSRQVLPDGGHAERTPQYHAQVLRDSLWALSLARARGFPLPVEEPLARMARWLEQARRGREWPRLNDSTPAADALAEEALSLAAALGLHAPAPPQKQLQLELPDTGWTRICDQGHELLFDRGPLGPEEQPGHGHSDALGFELYWAGQPVVTDSGVTTYEACAQRDYERSARAHAAVTVDGQGPDELWAAFRAARRGVVQSGAGLTGSVRAAAGWTHLRELEFIPGVRLRVTDRVRGARPGAIILAHLPLDPGFVRQLLPLRVLRGELFGEERGSIGRGFFRAEARPVLRIRADGEGVASYQLCASST